MKKTTPTNRRAQFSIERTYAASIEDVGVEFCFARCLLMRVAPHENSKTEAGDRPRVILHEARPLRLDCASSDGYRC